MTEHNTPEHTHHHTVHAGDTATTITIEATPTPVTVPTLISGLVEGRMVHYVLESGANKGQHRPAVVVRDWKESNGSANLQVFTDGENDGFNNEISVKDTDSGKFFVIRQSANSIWRTSVHYSEDKALGTWHFIEQA